MLSKLRRLSPTAFEEFVAALWEIQGWQTELTPDSHDKGIDVIASQSFPLDLQVHMQVKRFRPESKLNTSDVRSISGLAMSRDVNVVAIITTSSFTGPAVEFAADFNQIKLIDGNQLTDLIQQLGCERVLDRYLATEDWSRIELASYQGSVPLYSPAPNFPTGPHAPPARDEDHETSADEDGAAWRFQSVTALDGVGDDTANTLAREGIHTIGDLATVGVAQESSKFALSQSRLAALVSAAQDWDGGSITRITGIGPEKAAALTAAGVETVADLAGADPGAVAKYTESRVETVKKWIREAAYLRGDTALVRKLLPEESIPLESLENIGAQRADDFESLGIESAQDLAVVDPYAIAAESTFAVSQLRRWSRQARYSAY
ncbi:DUF4332 domain-containing protein [Halorubellus litoreus]|uniref:DUF4332 domain-containing protein n=1 Tax=Halorubellus litoreus TaxID=755308 RepID=A0ABD5VHD4_9EURY